MTQVAIDISDLTAITGLGIILERSCTQVEAEEVSNNRNKLHQTTYKHYLPAQYTVKVSIPFMYSVSI